MTETSPTLTPPEARREGIEAAGLALEAAWNSGEPPADGLPPIEFTPKEREYLASAVLRALSPTPDPAAVEALVEDITTLDVFLAAYDSESDGEVLASVIEPLDDLLTLGALRRILAALRTIGQP